MGGLEINPGPPRRASPLEQRGPDILKAGPPQGGLAPSHIITILIIYYLSLAFLLGRAGPLKGASPLLVGPTHPCNSHLRPAYHPSVWPGIPASQIPTPVTPRPTKRSSSGARNFREDELPEFFKKDKANFEEIQNEFIVNKRVMAVDYVAFLIQNVLYIQLVQFIFGSFNMRD